MPPSCTNAFRHCEHALGWPARCECCFGAGEQEAAGAFAFLRDEASMKMDSPRPHDVAPEAAAMLERLMLAQVPRCPQSREP